MSNIHIITDSASDISSADEQKYGITILPFQVVLGDKSYTSRIDFDNEGFYELMNQYDEIPKTAQITPFEFQELYLKEAKAGTTDLILVLINSQGSATYGNSLMAIEQFFDEYPEYRGTIRIHSFDGIGYSSLYGSPVVQAARMQKDGASADEICTYLAEILPRRQIYFGMYNLKYAGKSGRIPSAAAFLGDRLNLKPIMKIFANEIVTAAKCRGERLLISRIVDMAVDDMEPGSPYEIIYGSDPACMEEAVRLMSQQTGYGPADLYQIGAAIAANAGPRIIGISFTHKK